MINLLIKDFKLQFFTGASFKKKIIELIIKIILAGLLAIVITFIFNAVIGKVINYDRAPIAYLTLFLAIVSVIMVILNVLRAYKLFFNQKDIDVLVKMPVSNAEIITSKLVVIFGSHFVTSLIFVYPLFVAYFNQIGRSPKYYFLALFYPALSFLLEAGIALLIVYPFKLIVDYLKKHLLLQFILSIVIMFGFSILYARVLSTFMDLVVANNLTLLFTKEAISSMIDFTGKLFPLVFLVMFYLGIPARMFPYIAISLGIFVLGLAISIFAFSYLRNVRFATKKHKLKENLKVLKPSKALIKKELILLFKDSANMFSYSALLIVEPLLLYLVVYSLNGVFNSGSFQYLTLLIKGFVPLLDIVLIMLFTTITASGANNFISNERKTMKILKTIPVPPYKQVLYKVFVPYVLSTAALIISVVVLGITKTLVWGNCLFGFLLSFMLLTVFEVVSIKEELKIRQEEKKNATLSLSYAYIIPVAFFIISVILCFYEINIVIAYFVSMGIILFSGIPHIFNAKKKIDNDFLDLDVIN